MPQKDKKTTELKDYQRRVLDKLDKHNKILVYHGLGSGKTLTALSAAAKGGKGASIIGPASLRGNFKKEKKKHHVKVDTDYSSYSKPEPKNSDFLIFDEAHRMGRSESQRSKYPQKFKAKKVMMLTGTPIRNEPSELIPLLRGIDVDVPKSKEQFYKKYVQEKKISPGFLGKLKGIESGVERDGKNILDLAEKLKGKVDYHKNSKEGYPEVSQHTIKIPMSEKQLETYNMAMKEKPSLAYKIKHGIPPSKKESSSMNAFLTATRQISNTPASYNESSSGIQDSPKLQRMAKDIREKMKSDKNYKGVTYSNYLGSGVKPLAKTLEKQGIPYATFTGQTSKKDRKKIVEDYNKGKIRHLLISGAGSEGLDLKGTKMLQIMEPHWNEARIDQVKGRPIRYKSHANLPKDQRKIDVREYLSVSPDKDTTTTDQYISQLAKKKEHLNQDFKNALILGSALSTEDRSDKDLVADKLKENKDIEKAMKKQAASRLAIELAKKSPDEIAWMLMKNKRLGGMVHGKSLKTLGSGMEGAVELVGDKDWGVAVRKFTDLKSPITSLKASIDKTRALKKLENHPLTKNRFVKHKPGSFGLSQNKEVITTKSSYSPGLKRIAGKGVDKVKESRMKSHRDANKALGKTIYDITNNTANYNPRNDTVIDFLSSETVKGGEKTDFIRKQLLRQAKGAPIRQEAAKGYAKRKDLQRIYKAMDQKVLNNTDIEALSVGRLEPPNAKGIDYDKYVKEFDKWNDMAGKTPASDRILNLKKRFYKK